MGEPGTDGKALTWETRYINEPMANTFGKNMPVEAGGWRQHGEDRG
jgi:hypothetical protein